MDDNRIKELCFKYFKGKTNFPEEKEIFFFISGGDRNKTLFRAWEQSWNEARSKNPRIVMSFDNLKGRIEKRKRLRIRRVIYYAAACVAIVLAVGLGVNNYLSREYGKKTTVSTDYRQKDSVTLPDNSIVWLNSATTITYNSGFNKKNRTVTLSGEAFFDVTKNEKLPFVVKIRESRITVKGTKFNVTAYPKEDIVTASLLQGKIDFSNSSVSVSLVPNESLTYDSVSGSIVKWKNDASKSTGWMNGKLDYEDITMSRLLKRLSSIYGIDIQYKPSAAKEKEFSIILNESQSINDILDALSCIIPVTYKTIDGIIIVKDK